MSRINEKLGLKPAGKRAYMKLPKGRAAAAALTSATCPTCGRTGQRESLIRGELKRFCPWCSVSYPAPPTDGIY